MINIETLRTHELACSPFLQSLTFSQIRSCYLTGFWLGSPQKATQCNVMGTNVDFQQNNMQRCEKFLTLKDFRIFWQNLMDGKSNSSLEGPFRMTPGQEHLLIMYPTASFCDLAINGQEKNFRSRRTIHFIVGIGFSLPWEEFSRYQMMEWGTNGNP